MRFAPLVLGLIAVVFAFTTTRRLKPPAEPWLFRAPLRAIWRFGYLAVPAVLVAFLAPAVPTLWTDPSFGRSLAVGGMLLFVASLALVFWRAFKDSAVIITEKRLFVYPSSVDWRWVRQVARDRWGVRIQTAPDGPNRGRDLTIPTALYALPGEAMALMERLSGRAA